MAILIVVLCILLLVLLISFKINPFLAFLVVSLLTGGLLGIPIPELVGAVQKGIGDMLGSLVVIVILGAMQGKLIADSGAAQRIATAMMRLVGERYVNWAMLITGFVAGIPLFYNVGFVLLVPLIFSVTYQYRLPTVFVGLPLLASLSVTHGFLPPHPSPTALVAQFGADLGLTLIYGLIVGIPTVVLAGPVFARTVRHIHSEPLKTFVGKTLPEEELPSTFNSVISSLLPVILLVISTLLINILPKDSTWMPVLTFVGDPAIVMMVSLAIGTWSLGLRTGMTLGKIMDRYSDSVKDISIILLIISGAGALKQVLSQSGVSLAIAEGLQGLAIHPLVLGWLIAAAIRVCVGSATVAGLTAAGIIAPLVEQGLADPNLMVLAIGGGSLMFSHVNDSGFWMYKEYFNLSLKDTIRSWSLMETVVAVSGLAGVLLLDLWV